MLRPVLSCLLVILASPAIGATGEPDPSFNGTGLRVLAFDRGGNDHDLARALLLLPDGRIALAGHSAKGPDDADFTVTMLTGSGATDPAFGDGGLLSVAFDGLSPTYESVYALRRDSLGRLVMAGESGNDSDGYSMAVARATSSGAPDTSFSIDGKTLVGFGSDMQSAGYDMVVQPDDRIVVAGVVVDASMVYRAAIARLESSGGLDAGFGTGGRVLLSVGVGAVVLAQAVALQPDGRIVVAGAADSSTLADNYDMFALRLMPDGSLDTSFGDGGVRLLGFDLTTNGTDQATDIALRPDGRIVLAGSALEPSGGTMFAVAQLLADGTPDPAFGTAGLAVVDFNLSAAGEDLGEAVVLDRDGAIWVAGRAAAGGGNFDAAVLRLSPTGVPDSSFGPGGRRSFALDRGGDGLFDSDVAADVALDRQSRLLLAGYSASGDVYYQTDFLAMRLLGNAVFTSGFESE